MGRMIGAVSLAIGSPALVAATEAPAQRPLPPGALAAIEAEEFERAETLLRPAADACVAADTTHATCLNILNTLAYVGQMRADWKLQLAAARMSAEAAATHAPGTEYEYYALTNLSSALEDSQTPLEAEAPGRKALAVAEAIWSPQSDQVAIICRNLAILMTRLGRHADAEAFMRRAYAVRVAVSGADSVRALDSARVLAVTLNEGGKIAAAIALHAQTVATLTARYPDHLKELARAEGDYAAALADAGQYAEAARHYVRAVEYWEKLGSESEEVLTTLNNAARTFAAMGDYARAETLDRAVLRGKSARLGPEDPAMATSYGNLAVVIEAQGRADEARPLFRKALDIMVRAYGADHIRTAVYRGYLADLLPPAQEEEERRNLLAIYRQTLGPGHPDTLVALSNHAAALVKLGRNAEAEANLREIVVQGEQTYGPDNVKYADAMVELALAVARQLKPGSLAEMKSLFRRAWTIQAAVLGDQHTDTILSAVYLAQMSEGNDARTLSRRAQQGILERVARRRSFDAAAQNELRQFSPVFAQGVDIGWKLAHPAAPKAATN